MLWQCRLARRLGKKASGSEVHHCTLPMCTLYDAVVFFLELEKQQFISEVHRKHSLALGQKAEMERLLAVSMLLCYCM